MIQLSFSACQRYLLSPFSYYAHYLLRLRPVEQSSSLVFGSAIDSALNILLSIPLDINIENLIKAKNKFDELWNLVENQNIKYSKADLDQSLLPEDYNFQNKQWKSLQIKGHKILEAYWEQVIPKIKRIIAVQETINLTNDIGDSFTGIIDLIVEWEDSRIILFDNKTSSIKYAFNAVETSGQLATYYEAVKDKYKISHAGYIIISKHVRKKKLPLVPIEIMINNIPEELIEKTFSDYENVLDGIKNAQFNCTRNEKGGCCSLPWPCPYVGYCKSGGQDLSGLKYEEKRK